jgi:Tfp pilus assembly protein FimT
MKTFVAPARRLAGVLLIECLVYIAVFAILTGIGFAAFYLCWDQSRAVVYATDDISAALRMGERWRADIRSATGPVSIQPAADGQVVRISAQDRQIIYRFAGAEVRRETSTSKNSELLLSRVKTSQTSLEPRDGVAGCRWELELMPRRPETQLPLLFTFEAAQIKP